MTKQSNPHLVTLLSHVSTEFKRYPHIDAAVSLARKSLNLSHPNPAVGCVLVSPTGNIIGQGHTQAVGGAHAEVMALRDATSRGNSAEKSTAYVTLEPCSHFGRTPPCCNALVEAKVAKVVVAILDPNPLVAGNGVEMLRQAGIEVEVLPTDHPQAIAAKEQMIGFFSRMVRKTPWVRMKIAASLDGRTALQNGQSQWITGDAARDDGHVWRARTGAILTGSGTVLADDPRLDVRSVKTQRQPHVVIVDSDMQTPINAKLFTINNIVPQAIDTLARAIFIYKNAQNEAKQAALVAAGATVIELPNSAQSKHVDLRLMLQDLANREINEVHVEAGATLNGALIEANLVDEFLIYLAPKLLSAGRGMADFAPLKQLSDAVALEFVSVERIGEDLRIVARPLNRANFCRANF